MRYFTTLLAALLFLPRLFAAGPTPLVYELGSSNGTIIFYTNVNALKLDLTAVVPASTNSGNWQAVGTNSANLAPEGGTATMPFAAIGTNRVGSIIWTNGPSINVAAYCDAAASDYQGITNAIYNATHSRTNTLYWPSRIYTITNTIDIGVNTNGDYTFTGPPTWIGDGYNMTYLFFTTTGDGIHAVGLPPGGSRGPIIKNMSITSHTTNTASGLVISDCEGTILDNVFIGYWGYCDLYMTNAWRTKTYNCQFYTAGDATHAPLQMDKCYETDHYSPSMLSSSTNMVALIAADRFVKLNFHGGNYVSSGTAPCLAIQELVTVTNSTASEGLNLDGVAFESAGKYHILGGHAHNGRGLDGNGWSMRDFVMTLAECTLSASTNMWHGISLTNCIAGTFERCLFDGNATTTNEFSLDDCQKIRIVPSAFNANLVMPYVQTNGVTDTSATRLVTWEQGAAQAGFSVPTQFGNPYNTLGVVSFGPVTAGGEQTNGPTSLINASVIGNQITWGNPLTKGMLVGSKDGSASITYGSYQSNDNAYAVSAINIHPSRIRFAQTSGDMQFMGSYSNVLDNLITFTNLGRFYNHGSFSVGQFDNGTMGIGYAEIQNGLLVGSYGGTLPPGGGIASAGDIKFTAAAKRLDYASGANGTYGTGTLAAGTATISNTSVTANSDIWVQPTTISPVSGVIAVTSQTAATSFVVTSSNNGDTNTFKYWISEHH